MPDLGDLAQLPTILIGRVPQELLYVGLLFALFFFPRLLQRFRLPTAITSFFLGVASGLLFHAFREDATINLLSTFGIVGIFLFAGLEVNPRELRRGAGMLIQHLFIRLAVLAGGSVVLMSVFHLDFRPASLIALALLTPSTGFILGALDRFGLNEDERFWVKSKAIGSEILALLLLFLILRSGSTRELVTALGALGALLLALPAVFWIFARFIVPHAPKSEFAFLLMAAVVCAFATRSLGVYYLLGAFLVGVVAQRFKPSLPTMGSDKTLFAVEVFASFFAPFYFFHAGLHISADDFSVGALVIGALFLAIGVPAQFLLVAFHRRFASGEPVRSSTRVATAMLPTLVFTLVLAEILRDRYDISPFIFGGLVIYTVVNTLIPGFLLAIPPLEFDSPHLPENVRPRPHGLHSWDQ